MAAFDIYRAPSQAAHRGFVSSFFASLVSTVVEWNDERRTRQALDGLTDHELEDIGLCRGDIDAIARSGR